MKPGDMIRWGPHHGILLEYNPPDGEADPLDYSDHDAYQESRSGYLWILWTYLDDAALEPPPIWEGKLESGTISQCALSAWRSSNGWRPYTEA